MDKFGTKPRQLLKEILETVEGNQEERQKMDEADRYREGNQLTEEIRKFREDLGQPSPTVTLVTEAINSVRGQEIKRRTDTQVVGNTEEDNELAEAIGYLLQQEEEVLDIAQVDSEAYDGQIVPGIGWVYVGQSDNPMRRGRQVINVDRDDVITDRRGIRLDGSDCQWRVWRQFVTADHAKMILPGHEGLIDHVTKADAIDSPFDLGAYAYTGLDREHRGHLYRGEKTREIALFCVWYRDHEERTLIVDGESVEIYDPANLEHITQALDDDVLIEKANVPIMKEAWFVGPYLAEDGDSPHPHNEFPILEARGNMIRKSKRRYGLLEHAIGPQDQYNMLCMKISEILVSKRVMWEEGAFKIGPDGMKPEDVRHEFMRRDTMMELMPGGLNKVLVEQDWAELERVVKLKETAREEVRVAMGVNYSFTGEQEGQQSGVAIASLAELSAATMGHINSNYEFYRKRRAWLQIAHIIHDIGKKEHDVNIRDHAGGVVKTITLNKRDGYGVSNKLSMSKLRIKLKHVSTSQGYKAFNHQRLVEMHNSSEDPALRQALTPAIIKQSDVPDADEILEQYMKSTGQSSDPEAQKAAQAQQEFAQAMQQADLELKQAEARMKDAQAKKYLADANAPANPQQTENPDRKQALIQQLRSVTARNQMQGPQTLQ